MNNPIVQFKYIAIAEAISFIVLLAIAMPLKYFADFPLPVKIVGAIHGGLFILYCIALVRAGRYGRWSYLQMLLGFIASLLPFAPFWLEMKIKNEPAPSPAGEA